MAGTTTNAKGRVRLADPNVYFNRWLDTLAKRTSPQLPDGIPFFAANPDGGFYDIQTALNNLAFLQKASTWKTATVAAGVGTAAQAIWAGPGGKVLSITVQATGSANLVIYDNASTASGNILYTVLSTALIGTTLPVNSGVVNGITAGRVLNSPAITLTYCEV
jgi:hypothetical protein